MGETLKTLRRVKRKFKVSRKIKPGFLQRNENQIDIILLIKKHWNKMFTILKKNDFDPQILYSVKVAQFEWPTKDI